MLVSAVEQSQSATCKWQPTPVFLPGESQGQASLVGFCLRGRTESDTTDVTQQQQQQHTHILSSMDFLPRLLSHKKEQNCAIFRHVDEPRDCHTEWRQEEKNKYRILTHVCTIWKSDAGELICKQLCSDPLCLEVPWKVLVSPVLLTNGLQTGHCHASHLPLLCADTSCKFRLSPVRLTDQPQTRGCCNCVLRLGQFTRVSFRTQETCLLPG